MKKILFIFLSIIVVIAILCFCVGRQIRIENLANVGNYKIDFEPQNLFNLPPTEPLPSRINVYVTGPTTGHDKIATSILYSKFTPQYSTTNYVEISNLVVVLSHEDITEKITNVLRHVGYTYHLLLFQDSNKTVMHFRVFLPSDVRTDWYDVWPQSSTSFGFFNQEIGLWLQSRIKENTNQLEVKP